MTSMVPSSVERTDDVPKRIEEGMNMWMRLPKIVYSSVGPLMCVRVCTLSYGK